MVTKMILISILILATTFATWVKDGDKMDPPFKRRLVIDVTVVGIFWVLYGVFYFTKEPGTEVLAASIINIALIYFVSQLVLLVGQFDQFKGLIKQLKDKGIEVPEDKKGE